LKGGANEQDNYDTAKYDIPAYKEPLNNPMIPNEQKRIYAENKQPEKINPNQILNLQLFQPPKPKAPAGQPGTMPNPAVFQPILQPNPYDPRAYANYMQYMGYNMQPAPVYKEYNININGVSGSHLKTAVLFEDALPIKNVSGTFNSVGERVTMYEAIRSTLFTAGDGKDVSIENDSYNLLSHLKLMDMNPYNASRFSPNPYKGLPSGFLLYRSCYPIRHDSRNGTSVCATNSTGVNLRIYRLTEGAYMINKQNITKLSDYDEWRDIAFYNYVKEHIVKKKVCPNFPIMYGYNITINSGINFDELMMIQDRTRMTDKPLIPNQGLPNTSLYQQNPSYLTQVRRDQKMPINQPLPLNNGVNRQIAMVRDPATGVLRQHITIIPTPEEEAIALNKYTGKTLVCLTEASNYSITGWAKKEYRAEGNIKTMINSGYHTKAVWESIIFQMLAALYTMQLHGIVINGFRLDRNVFIKDINTGGAVTNYWKYKIEGIEYYIPNHGYIVLIDTNFRDFDKTIDAGKETDLTRERKLEAPFIDNKKLAIDEYIAKIFDMFRSAIDPNIFDNDFSNDNGVKPPEEILRLLTNIKNMADSKPTMSIAYYIRKFMTMFMNNRVGTLLADNEMNNIKRDGMKEFRKGQIVTMKDQDGIDKFVICIQQKGDISKIITKDKVTSDANIIEKEVPTSSLCEYSLAEPVKQIFKMNESNLSEDTLLETYNIE
jgi:hypothetical protein